MKDYYLKYLKYKSKYLKLKGGEEIGPKVFRPPLIFEQKNSSYETNDFVGKIISKEDGEEEFRKSNLVRQLDPSGNWSITMDFFGLINREQSDKDYKLTYFDENKLTHQLISKFGGISFQKVIGYDDDDLSKLKCEKLPLFIKLIKRSVKSIDTLNTGGYRHNDLHLGNILYDESKDSVLLMDFGKLVSNDGESDFENYYFFIKSVISACKKKNFTSELETWLALKGFDYRELILALPDLPEAK